MIELGRNLGNVESDDLIYGAVPEPQVDGAVIAKGDAKKTYLRGTIMTKNSAGTLAVLGENPSGEITEDFNGTGAATTFTLTVSPLPTSIKEVLVGTTKATVSAYNAQTGVVTLSSAPASGTKNVHIKYDAPAPDVPFGVLCDTITVGTEEDENVAVYTAGCFNLNKIVVATGYTISDADEDELRMRNIILRTAIPA